ncbi:MAG: hypothetical protein DWH91_04425 [Planctomycetota bacterium]|nr:MAG: hypothetical protein DWH91_04425 [Planctomycetota bacterium]
MDVGIDELHGMSHVTEGHQNSSCEREESIGSFSVHIFRDRSESMTHSGTSGQKVLLGSLCGQEGEAPAEPRLIENLAPVHAARQESRLPTWQIHKLASRGTPAGSVCVRQNK